MSEGQIMALTIRASTLWRTGPRVVGYCFLRIEHYSHLTIIITRRVWKRRLFLPKLNWLFLLSKLGIQTIVASENKGNTRSINSDAHRNSAQVTSSASSRTLSPDFSEHWSARPFLYQFLSLQLVQKDWGRSVGGDYSGS